MHSPINHHRGRVAGLSRDRKPNDPDLLAARRDLKAELLAKYIEKTVASAPPLEPHINGGRPCCKACDHPPKERP